MMPRIVSAFLPGNQIKKTQCMINKAIIMVAKRRPIQARGRSHLRSVTLKKFLILIPCTVAQVAYNIN